MRKLWERSPTARGAGFRHQAMEVRILSFPLELVAQLGRRCSILVICEECSKVFNKSPASIKRTNHNFCSQSCSGKYNGRRRRGPYKNRKKEYLAAIQLRKQGYGYRTIGRKLGVNFATVANWVKAIPADPAIAHKISAEYFKAPYKSFVELRRRCSWQRS